jgi:hypothetical protein
LLAFVIALYGQSCPLLSQLLGAQDIFMPEVMLLGPSDQRSDSALGPVVAVSQ